MPPTGELLPRFLEFQARHRGLSDGSLRHHRKHLSEFLEFAGTRNKQMTALEVADLDGYAEEVAGRGKGRVYLGQRLSTLRSFLRYLYHEEWLERDLSAFVCGPRVYRDSDLPPHFQWKELEQLVASVKGDEPLALRDRAMLALLTVYGLRSSEVAGIKVDHIDWKHETLRIPVRKTGHPLVLPLLPVVAAILQQYLLKGRSSSGEESFLLTSDGRPIPSGAWVTGRLHVLVSQAGLKGGRGCHAIRRAVGTRLIELGWSVVAVAEILGHRSLSSTQIYLRLSMELLRDVADNYGETL